MPWTINPEDAIGARVAHHVHDGVITASDITSDRDSHPTATISGNTKVGDCPPGVARTQPQATPGGAPA